MKMKFQMNIDEKSIRTIEELQENFNIDEILDLYEDGTFEKWLSSRNHIKELEKLKEIKSKEEKEIIAKLIEIFDIDRDEETVEKALLYRNYRKENYGKLIVSSKCDDEVEITNSINSKEKEMILINGDVKKEIKENSSEEFNLLAGKYMVKLSGDAEDIRDVKVEGNKSITVEFKKHLNKGRRKIMCLQDRIKEKAIIKSDKERAIAKAKRSLGISRKIDMTNREQEKYEELLDSWKNNDRKDDEEDILNSLGDIEYKIANAIERSKLPDESKDYLLDVIIEIESRKETGSEEIISIAKDIAYEYKFKFLGEGTSRLAILDTDDNVLKISHRMLGDVDNRFEKAITQLVLDKHVSRDCANRLALCFDVDLDTDWVIAQEEYAPLAKDQANNKGRAAIKYVVQNYNDYKDMIKTLESEFFLSDIHPKRGFNIGLDENSRMVVIDHGLFIPLCLIDNGVVFDSGFSYKKGKFHCKCGSAIHYDIPKLSGNLEDDIDDLIDDGSPLSAERYICPDCRTLYDPRRMYKEILDSVDRVVRDDRDVARRDSRELLIL